MLFSSRAQAQSDPAQILQSLDQQSEEFSAEWLASPDPRLRAWGAYEVLRDRQTNQIPTLLSQIAAYKANPVPFAVPFRDPAHDAMLAVLDAAIQLNAEVPAADAAKLYPEFPAQSVILLSRSKERVSSYLLNIFEDPKAGLGAWLAAGNFLARDSAPGFAAALLNTTVIHSSIDVRMPSQKPRGIGIAGDSVGNIPEPKPGWPEMGNYTLSGCAQTPSEGMIVLAGGINTAYYYRRVNSNYDHGSQESFCFVLNRDTFREHLLDLLTNDSVENSPLSATVNLGISWRGPADYRSRVNALIAKEQAEVRNVIWRLKCSGMLTADESIAGPRIEITIWDQRPQGSRPLPLFRSLPPNISMSSFH